MPPFRLGEHMKVRLPTAARYSAQVLKEDRWLLYLAPYLPVRIPTPLALGSPNDEYPFPWSICSWIREVLDLFETRDTIERSAKAPIELDVVTHDVKKFFGLLLKRNGYVLEQLYSPLTVKTSAEHDELKKIGTGCVTRYHSHHYLGFASTQWRQFETEEPQRVKPLLYTLRVLMTGIRLMNTGQIEANLPRLNEEFRLPYIDELVFRKTQGAEREVLTESDVGFYREEYHRLRSELELSSERSTLPESSTCKQELSDLLVRLREQSQTHSERGG